MNVYNCSACEELREVDPNLFVNGIGMAECTSLANDTGLVASNENNDCTDLESMNDCLVGNMQKEIEAESVCNWKPFVKALIGNVWTMFKGIICAICGIWTNIHELWEKVNCLIDSVKRLINALNSTTQGQAFVKFYRDNSGTSTGMYQWDINDGSSHTLDIYMNADVDYAGSQPADRDYVVIVQNCTDIHSTDHVGIDLTFYSSGDTRSIATIRKRQAQHPHVNMNGASVSNFSWTTSGATLIRKGEHLKVNSYVYSGNSGWYRLHQFVITWIPVNLGTNPLNPSEIIPC